MSRRSPPMPGNRAMSGRLAEMIRVDHAGEFGAVNIYRGQRAVFDRSESKAHAARLIGEMEAGEQEHLKTFDRLIAERGVRPTLLAPVWRIAGFGLGAAQAIGTCRTNGTTRIPRRADCGAQIHHCLRKIAGSLRRGEAIDKRSQFRLFRLGEKPGHDPFDIAINHYCAIAECDRGYRGSRVSADAGQPE